VYQQSSFIIAHLLSIPSPTYGGHSDTIQKKKVKIIFLLPYSLSVKDGITIIIIILDQLDKGFIGGK
jgi:hypothetical protein